MSQERTAESLPIREKDPPIEDEMRVCEVDKVALGEKLLSRGARLEWEGTITDVKIDTPSGLLKKNGFQIRIRHLVSSSGEESFEFSVKKFQDRKEGSIRRTEATLYFSSYEEAITVSESVIGDIVRNEKIDLQGESIVFKNVLIKHRSQYVLGNVSFEVDTLVSEQKFGKELEDLSFVPPYVDIEIIYPQDADEQEVERLYEERRRYMEELGLEVSETVPNTKDEMVKYYRERHQKR